MLLSSAPFPAPEPLALPHAAGRSQGPEAILLLAAAEEALRAPGAAAALRLPPALTALLTLRLGDAILCRTQLAAVCALPLLHELQLSCVAVTGPPFDDAGQVATALLVPPSLSLARVCLAGGVWPNATRADRTLCRVMGLRVLGEAAPHATFVVEAGEPYQLHVRAAEVALSLSAAVLSFISRWVCAPGRGGRGKPVRALCCQRCSDACTGGL